MSLSLMNAVRNAMYSLFILYIALVVLWAYWKPWRSAPHQFVSFYLCV